MSQLQSLLPLLIPLVIIQLLLFVIAVVDLFKEERQVRWFSKPVWALIIFFVNIIGPLAYFFAGRENV
ncbi:MAG: PLD nuclease N-terminal domain-containing protein [Candidatus Limnocylindrales bacterium]